MLSPRIWRILIVLTLVSAGLFYALYFESPAQPALPGSYSKRAVTWDDRARSFGIYVPEKPADQPALVFVFHGSAGDAGQSRMMYGYAFEELAEEHGFIVVYPEGFDRHFNGCRSAGPYAANELKIDDVGFMRDLVGQMSMEFGVNREAVFATGISNGGQMALRLALEAPDLVAAVAVVATSLPAPGNMDCEPAGRPVAFLLMNGTNDPMNPYGGGKVALYGLLGDRGEVLSSSDTAMYWAALAGHEGAPEKSILEDRFTADNSTVVVEQWETAGKPPVALYTVVGGGHSAPHPAIRLPRLLGGSNRDFVAAREILAFFQRATD